MKSKLGLISFVFFTNITISPLLADEVWNTEEYQVIYQEERNNTAIWTYNNGQGTIFIDGLAGQYTQRTSYSGYWTQNSSSLPCDTFREGADGQPTYYWGRFDITFKNPDFPSFWQAKIGLCDRKPNLILNGSPVTN